MRFKSILSRLTGISCPVFGVSWEPPKDEVQFARRLISFLEDRRVLYVPAEAEVPPHCVESVLMIREFLTDQLGELSGDGQLVAAMRSMRGACRQFLGRIEGGGSRVVLHASDRGHFAVWVFNDALGQLRAGFGLQIGIVAVAYGVDIEKDLEGILPPEPE